ncbi:Growth hormone secretagogue receptor type 1 [Frankliniella fusca]|uniref:Growth hormone secretagogue receptor type 1 n=1 Tax=Frankliniella fusca TaxID=407009 RepID=A0AAE1HDS9_9NEOP|nr:Growth hormone secretagogue receptor type 1 [Frankliniella fusca]
MACRDQKDSSAAIMFPKLVVLGAVDPIIHWPRRRQAGAWASAELRARLLLSESSTFQRSSGSDSKFKTLEGVNSFGGGGKAVPFVELTVAHASVLTILAISFERYYAICEPLKAGYVCTKERALLICFCAWAFAAIFTSEMWDLQPYQSFSSGTFRFYACGKLSDFVGQLRLLTSWLTKG